MEFSLIDCFFIIENVPGMATLYNGEIKEEILKAYKHGGTIVKSTGMYSGDENYMIFCVMNIGEIPGLMNILKKYPETFVYFSEKVRVQGDFHFNEEEIGRWVSAFK